jgi:hypothetical protein
MLADITADFERLTGDFRPLAETRPFSPEAYNAISTTLMRHYYKAVGDIEALHGVGYPSNIGVLLFSALHVAACQHYFREYDLASGITDDAPPPGAGFSLAGALRLGDARRQLRKLLSSLGGRRGAHDARVAFAGTTTFPWGPLQQRLASMNVHLNAAPAGRPGAIPLLAQQRLHLQTWASDGHEALAAEIRPLITNLRPFSVSHVNEAVVGLMRMPVAERPAVDLLVTGSLGSLPTRVAAMNAISHAVPVLTIHHGAQYKLVDEPYYDLYEGMLPTAKMVYGSIDRQRELGTLARERTLAGNDTMLFTRTDSLVRSLHGGESIPTVESLQGKRVLYLTTEFETGRYGPYRDVHPTTYRTWQQTLIDWLTAQSGQQPMVRLHPKRPSTQFDPQGFRASDGPLREALDAADVFVIDYPTTSLAHVAATSKPILFFDLGLRRLYPAALDIVKARCAYAPTDVLEPGTGLAAMEGQLDRTFVDNFSPAFTIADSSHADSGGDEVTTVAKAIVNAVARLR